MDGLGPETVGGGLLLGHEELWFTDLKKDVSLEWILWYDFQV